MDTTLQLQSWEQFKAERKLGMLQPIQKNGRRFIPLGTETVILGEKTDTSKPLFVVLNGAHHENGTRWLVNTSAQAVGNAI